MKPNKVRIVITIILIIGIIGSTYIFKGQLSKIKHLNRFIKTSSLNIKGKGVKVLEGTWEGVDNSKTAGTEMIISNVTTNYFEFTINVTSRI